MCTVSTSATASSLVVTMNRDERRRRLEGPLVRTEDSCYPTDAQAGGTWCGVNRFGLMFCLLNRYDAPLSDAASMISRGDIIPQALKCHSVGEVADFISELDLTRYNGFKLQVFSQTVCWQHDWDRQVYSSIEHPDPDSIFSSSSSLRSLSIPAEREQRYRAFRHSQALAEADTHSVGTIPKIHVYDPTVPPSDAVFMVRRDTHTKSICQMAISDGEAHLYYWPAQHGFSENRVERWSQRLQVVNSPSVDTAKTCH